jgi:hypothetical protein
MSRPFNETKFLALSHLQSKMAFTIPMLPSEPGQMSTTILAPPKRGDVDQISIPLMPLFAWK